MAIVVGIDGTGSAFVPGSGRDRDYDVAFANSFVSKICKGGGPNKTYFRGPVALGGGLVEAIAGGVRFVQARRAARVTDPVVLTGYSRGAAGAIAIAAQLQRLGIGVRALLLFDCVDRHLAVDAEVIPNNVGFVHHVIRSSRSGSRESFGNDGMSYRAPTVFPAAYSFMCTHGGMGGCPWTPARGQRMTDLINEGGVDGATNITFAQDASVSQQVWAHCLPFMRTHGFI
ncbi:MAG: thioesterase domain-containing protein [Pyrinomonadaceae bacterium]